MPVLASQVKQNFEMNCIRLLPGLNWMNAMPAEHVFLEVSVRLRSRRHPGIILFSPRSARSPHSHAVHALTAGH